MNEHLPTRVQSRNCLNIFDDGPGDMTIRPARPVLRKLGEEERARIAKWEQYLKENRQSYEGNSHDVVDIIDDGPGDNTIRPIPPERLPHALKEKERIAKWEKYLKENPPQPPEECPPAESST